MLTRCEKARGGGIATVARLAVLSETLVTFESSDDWDCARFSDCGGREVCAAIRHILYISKMAGYPREEAALLANEHLAKSRYPTH